MIIRKNDKISLIHTGQTARVVRLVDASTVLVEIDGDNSPIPIDISAISLLGGLESSASSIEEEKFVSFIDGFKLLWLPITTEVGLENAYHLYFSNGTDHHWHLDLSISLHTPTLTKKAPIDARYMYPVGLIRRDLLNEKPKIHIELYPRGISRMNTLSLSQQIKAKTLFSNRLDLNDGKYCYSMSLSPHKKSQIKADKKIDIIRRNIEDDYLSTQSLDIDLSLERSIDLHAEALNIPYRDMSNREILEAQLEHFRQYLDRAIVSNLDTVFIIHGIGQGILKSRIHEILPKEYNIDTFINHYHPLYGMGATEVHLK